MGLKERIKKLEQYPGIEQKRSLVIYTLANARPYIPAELEAYRDTLDWKGKKTHAVCWNGEKFIDKGGNGTPQDRDLEIQVSDEGIMELLNEISQGIEPHQEVTA